ncbi:FadR/GntR family transcriptional regulator [Ornithinibacillus scapharcae]|uniref:FadR/GntR family transcriptional regulator n=1 Tax=Ornithinibacillus scapharcae TaxID=1147159 RepID=UPI000527FF54|nr:GntR family transcriptional regulator [Ornithinibacillus scapharcae]
MSPKQKVYQGVLEEIRNYIESEDLRPGDKLPSERELSDKLQAGRSSVREALRAMELIGVVETRHGGGTFLSKYRPYQTVKLLSTFILNQSTESELVMVKYLLEKEVAKLVSHSIDESKIEQLQEIVNQPEISMKEKHYQFFSFLFELTDNQLFSRIWGLIDDYSKQFTVQYSEVFYQKLIQLLSLQDNKSIEDLFEKEMY